MPPWLPHPKALPKRARALSLVSPHTGHQERQAMVQCIKQMLSFCVTKIQPKDRTG